VLSLSPLPTRVHSEQDMGWGDWSRTGSPAKDVPGGGTPHLDAMSRSAGAVWFERAYSGNPICSPTRASVLTGRTPARTCIYNVDHHILCRAGEGGTTDSSPPCKRGEYSLANATRDKGYLSGFYGKW
jgi:arylsulfatase A-like enzyme